MELVPSKALAIICAAVADKLSVQLRIPLKMVEMCCWGLPDIGLTTDITESPSICGELQHLTYGL
jgi:hypothetical protein